MEFSKCDKYKLRYSSWISFAEYVGCNWLICSVQTNLKPIMRAKDFSFQRGGVVRTPHSSSRREPHVSLVKLLNCESDAAPTQVSGTFFISCAREACKTELFYIISPYCKCQGQLHSKPVTTQPLASCHPTMERRWRGREMGPSPAPAFPRHSTPFSIAPHLQPTCISTCGEVCGGGIVLKDCLDISWGTLLPNFHLALKISIAQLREAIKCGSCHWAQYSSSLLLLELHSPFCVERTLFYKAFWTSRTGLDFTFKVSFNHQNPFPVPLFKWPSFFNSLLKLLPILHLSSEKLCSIYRS